MDGLRPIHFIPGCNTPAEVIRAQFVKNIERDLPWLAEGDLTGRPLAIVAGGPSLKYYWHELLTFDGEILALNNAYSFLLEQGINPDYFMLLDARQENVEFVRNIGETLHFIAAQCHPDVFDALKGADVTLYLTTLPYARELTAHIDKPKHLIAGNVGTVGFKALCLAHALGYRELHLYGYDSSYAETHHAFPQALNDGASTIDVYLNGKQYVTTPTFALQASEFCWFAAGMVREHGYTIELHCDGLLPDLVALGNKDGEVPLELREQQKYEQAWASPIYRKTAPGELYVTAAIQGLRMLPGDSVIDFGCGTGRGAQAFKDLGYKVTAVDFAANCLDPGVDVPFVQSCLWGMPPMQADWGYCTDVMEHIPTEKVGDVLRNIRERCKGAYFSIATAEERLGWITGKKLHMTIMDAGQWLNLLKRYWANVTVTEGEGGVLCVCT